MTLYRPGRDVFTASALEVAPKLLGAVLRHETAEGVVGIRISEVEAYVGDGVDPGSHSFRGRTKRNAVMYGGPGHLYTYFTYGMHVCANAVCSPEGESSAVGGGGGVGGVGAGGAAGRRGGPPGRAVTARAGARGPARLVVAAGILLSENGSDLFASPFDLLLPTEQPPYETGPRTGVSGAGGSLTFPWRYWIPGDPTVSPYKRHPKSH